jgi:SAM-dependent methyltransferase
MDERGGSAEATAEHDIATRESIRIQAEDHPLIDDAPSTSINQHVGRLMHIKAYEVAAESAMSVDVLDVGCNTGYGTILLARFGRRVVGVDVSPRAIEAATAAAVDGRPEFLAIDGVSLPFADASFDLVTSFQVLEHVLDPVPYLREIARVLRPGGSVVLTTPNAATRLDPGMTPWNPFHVREYHASELEAELRRVFPSVRIRGMFGTPTLYEAELARVDAARRRIRARTAAAAAAAAAAKGSMRSLSRRPLPVRIAKRVVPAGLRRRLRSLRGRVGATRSSTERATATATVSPPPIDLATFLRFTSADLFYADTDLDRAMDFLAVCRLDGGA